MATFDARARDRVDARTRVRTSRDIAREGFRHRSDARAAVDARDWGWGGGVGDES